MSRLSPPIPVAMLLVLAPGHVVSQEEPVSKTEIQFLVVGTRSGAQTIPLGAAADHVAEGTSTKADIQVRFTDASASRACGGGIMVTALPPDGPHGPGPLWRAKAYVRHAGMDNITIDYEWKRQVDSAAATLADGEDKGTVVVKEIWPVLLDAVPASEASNGCFRNLALILVAKPPEDPATRERRIAYDVWLVVDGPGRHWSRRLQLIGRQSETVGFDYGVFRSRLTGVALSKSPYPQSDIVETTVTGSVRGRIQGDGSIDLRLAASRAAHPTDGRWSKIEHGEKVVRAAAGETLRLELPPPAAWDAARDPETFKTLAQERVALVLTPTPVD